MEAAVSKYVKTLWGHQLILIFGRDNYSQASLVHGDSYSPVSYFIDSLIKNPRQINVHTNHSQT